jgi:hypothetical protein
MGFLVGIILSYLFTEKEITSDVIMGAICGYFLIGLLWNNVYILIEVLEPNSFQLSHGAGRFVKEEILFLKKPERRCSNGQTGGIC